MIVYRVTNKINGKVYIGISSDTLEQRMSGHRFRSRQGSLCLFHRAIRKYGWDNFQPEILFENLEEKEAKSKEIELIESHGSYGKGKGYNMTPGGDGGPCTPEKAANISKAKKGKSNPHMLVVGYQKGKHWYTNGIKDICTFEAPEGFKPGRRINWNTRP